MFNQTATTSAFGSGTSGSLFGGGSSGGSAFGANNNNNNSSNTGNSFGGFGSQIQNNTPSPFGFGANNNTNNSAFGAQNQQKPALGASGTGTSLFGQPPQQQQQQQFQPQQTSLFGGSASKPTGGSLLGNSTGATNSLFANASPVLPIPNPNESLFQNTSLFSVSSSDADAAKFKESLNGQQAQPQAQSQFQNSAYPASPSTNNTPNPSMTLRHSQSSITLGNGPGLRHPNTPNWAKEKRFKPTTPSNLRHVSSFNTSERGPISVRKASPSQSPTNSFGTSFSGVSRPSQTKKKSIMQEDPPPARSIYDSDSSNLSLIHRTESSMTINRRSSMASNIGTPSSSTPRPVKTTDYSLSVVIFGFPSSVTPAVVAHFSRFGTISENVDSSSRLSLMSSPNKSLRAPPTPIQTGKNWLKITYDSPASAARAIQENGTLIAGQYVVGCIPLTSHNHKEFEIASETSMLASLRSPGGESMGDYSIFDDTTIDFTDGNILPPSEPEELEDRSSVLGQNNGKSLARTVSMPSLAGSKQVKLKDGRAIFNKSGKQVRYSPSLFGIAQEPDQDTKTAEKSYALGPDGDKRLQGGKQGWMSWTSKKAQELVFGWDDL